MTEQSPTRCYMAMVIHKANQGDQHPRSAYSNELRPRNQSRITKNRQRYEKSDYDGHSTTAWGWNGVRASRIGDIDNVSTQSITT
ncbi:hypothetical protein AN403_741 [Pseudomonas fluorescens]|uniref:Uncharacterized protein n=1 Tax=Pseudomonas fluorescens TaxID=294 RepID=A0A0P8WIQ1_PSEFL|nr:hypothetical protein AN403_741 [Pseudomonas fluorescens]